LMFREPILKRKPLREILRRRPTIILRAPIVELLGLDPPEVVPEGVKVDRVLTKEELVKAVEMSAWASHLAEGMAERGKLKKCTKAYHTFVGHLKRAVAEGFVKTILRGAA